MSQILTLRARLAAPAAEVHRALTDPAALRAWFAEHAEVDLPDRYEFWGRYTPAGDAPHQRLLHLDDTTLRFDWLLDGEHTTVEIALQDGDDAGSTLLTLTQTHLPDWDELLAGATVRSVLHTFWSLAIANLADHLDGRPLTARGDLGSPQLREQVVIDASPTAVYESLVDPAVFRRWFGADIEIEPHVGGRLALGGFELDPTPAKILELEPGRTLASQWPDGTVVRWELADSAGKTRLTFVQSGFDPASPHYGSWLGWLAGIAELRRYHELPDWRPMWVEVDVPGVPEGIVAT